MADNLPTAEQALGKPLPSAEEALGTDPSQNKGIFSGALSDAYFAAGAPNRILHSFSQGASQGWGATQDSVSPETSTYRQGGPQVGKEYHEGRSAVLKAANESWMRSAAHTVWDKMNAGARVFNYAASHPLDTALGIVPGIFGGISEAFHQGGAELEHAGKKLEPAGINTPYGRLSLGTAVGGLGEAAVHMGGVPMDTSDPTNTAMSMLLPNHPMTIDLNRGRTFGGIGESEGKYFGTVDLTARDHSARAEALSQLVDNKDTSDTIHHVARQYAPKAFEDYDYLSDHRNVFQDQLDKAIKEQQNDPEYRAAQSEIDNILESVNHDESELTEERASELSALRDKIEADSPAVADARKTLSGVESRITDLSPHIQDAYQLAEAGNRRLNPDAQPEQPRQPRPAPKSAEELSRGEIAKDVEAKLLKAGRPADEAKIAGILWQQRYENRVGKSPHLGTAEELYKNEGPDILKGKEGSDGKNALNQYVGSKAFRGTKEGLERSKKLSTAVKMESAGKTPEQISLATGWVRSPFDKKWKFEISDKDASLTKAWNDLTESKLFGETHETTLGEIMKHDRLFEAYPDAKNIKVTKRKGLFDFGGLQGSFDEERNILNLTPYAKDHLSTALHEIQHWIQAKEGFARGGNTETVFEHLSPEKKMGLFKEAIETTKKAFDSAAEAKEVFKKASEKLYLVDVRNYRELNKYQDDLWKDYQRLQKEEPDSARTKIAKDEWLTIFREQRVYREAVQKDLFGQERLKMSDAEKEADYQISRILDGQKTEEEVLKSLDDKTLELQDTLSKLQNGDEKVLKKTSGDASYKFYRAIAGEMEARDTQARKDLTEQERAEKPPLDSQNDIDPDDVITHFGDSKSAELFQHGEEKAPGFFSALTKTLKGLTAEKAHPQDWLGLIDNLKGVKKEEVDWSGVKSWLGQQYRNGVKSVSKEEVLRQIEQHQVEVHEVTREDATPEVLRYVDVQNTIDDLEYTKEHYSAEGGAYLGYETWTPEDEARLQELKKEAEELRPKVANKNYDTIPTKYKQYTQSGGKNYKEIVLTNKVQKSDYDRLVDEREQNIHDIWDAKETLQASAHDTERYDAAELRLNELYAKQEDLDRQLSRTSSKEKSYQSPHWDEKNVLAHIRFDERVGPNGERVLHIAEIQSDWHQQGRKYGYEGPEQKAVKDRLSEASKNIKNIQERLAKEQGFKNFSDFLAEDRWVNRVKPGETDEQFSKRSSEYFRKADLIANNPELEQARIEYTSAQDAFYELSEVVPDAPFKGTWHKLALKRMIRYAAENGFDTISWDTGKTNADRYSLSKKIKNLHVTHDGSEFHVSGYDHNDFHVLAHSVKDERELENLVGKEVSTRIIEKLEEAKASKKKEFDAEDIDFKLVSHDAPELGRHPESVIRDVKRFREARGQNPDAPIAAYRHKGDRHWSAKFDEHTTVDDILKEIRLEDDPHTSFGRINRERQSPPTANLEGLDLDIGGKGMEGFYDKILPDAANELGKKYGSKVKPIELEKDKIQSANGGWSAANGPNPFEISSPDDAPNKYQLKNTVTGEVFGPYDSYTEVSTKAEIETNLYMAKLNKEGPEKFTAHSLSIPHEMSKSVLETGQSLFQQKKGSLTRGAPRNIIKLFRAADSSTFFHETGHQWLEELVKDGSHPEASEELKADLKAARDFLGNKGEPLTRAQHEKFARSFERYLREGHAPTKELTVLFQRFKEWLTDIYKTLRDLPNSKIDDSIRDVFDRLIVPERTRDVVAPELEQRGTARQRQRDLENHIQEIKEHARSKQIFEFMEQVRARAATKANPEGKTSKKQNIIGPEGKPLPEPTPAESESGTAEVVSDNPAEKDQDTNPDAEIKITSGPLVDKAGNIRVENLTSDQDLADSIKLAYEANKEELDKSRGKVSSQATIDLAEAGGIKTKEVNMKALVRAAENGGVPLSSYISLLRNAFLESSKTLKGIMAGNDEIAYAEAVTRHLALSRHLMGITAEWGRAGHSFRSLAEEARQAEELTEFLQMSIGKSLKQLRTEMKLGRYLDNSREVSGFVQDMSKVGYGEWILEAFKNWLISGPITHATYAVGNEIFALNRLLESAARVGISKGRDALTGSSDAQSSNIGEVRERMYGLMSGHKDGLRAAWTSFKAGETALLPGEERATTAFTQHRTVPDYKIGKVSLPLGSTVRLPSERMVAPLHSFARSVAFMEERNGLIFRKAYNEGLRGDDLTRRIAELKNNVPVDITVAARAAASEAALMGKAGEFTRKAVAVVNSELQFPMWAGGTWRPGGFIAPFITVSSNINRLALLERSPLGVFSKSVREDMSGANGRFKQDVAISKMTVGTAIGVAVGTLYMEGTINAAAPEDFKAATVEQMVNGMPHSIRVGEMSYDLNRLGVIGTEISMAANLAVFTKKGVFEALEEGNPHLTEEAAVEWSKGMFEHLESEGFLSGITDVIKAVSESDRYGESWTKNFVSSLIVPYSIGMSQMAQRIDPYARDTHGVGTLDSISRAVRARIPFESETLEPKVDLFGQPVPQREYWGVYATAITQDPVWIALKGAGYFPAPVKRTINGVKLTPEQYHNYATKAGTISKMLLDNIVNTADFHNLDKTTQHEMMKDAMTSGRQAASEIVKAEYMGTPDDIVKKASEMKEQLSKDSE